MMQTTLERKVRRGTPGRWRRGAIGALVALAALGAGSDAAQAQDSEVFVGPDWLRARMDEPELVILQVGPPELYGEQHVPGAVSTSHRELVRPMGDGPHDTHLVLELPEPDALRARLEALGISDDSRIVVVPAAAWVTPAARVAFTLHHAGLGERTHVLDGGLEAWVAAGGPVTAEMTEASPGRLTRPFPGRTVASDWVVEHGTDAGVVMLDGRAPAFYDGVRDDQGAVGHIPGARSLPWQELIESDDEDRWRMKEADALRALFRERGAEPGSEVVAYCHIGQFGSLLFLAARSLGYDARLYDGSVNEWRLLDLPFETGAGEGE